MRFISYIKPGGRNPLDRMMGVLIGDKVAPLAAIDVFYDDLPGWKKRASKPKAGEIPLSDLQLAPPVPRDAKIVCAAINYVKHGAEAKLPTPTFPNLFARWASELVVDGTQIAVPADEPDGLDWEVELAAIVGAMAVDVSFLSARPVSSRPLVLPRAISGLRSTPRSAEIMTRWLINGLPREMFFTPDGKWRVGNPSGLKPRTRPITPKPSPHQEEGRDARGRYMAGRSSQYYPRRDYST